MKVLSLLFLGMLATSPAYAFITCDNCGSSAYADQRPGRAAGPSERDWLATLGIRSMRTFRGGSGSLGKSTGRTVTGGSQERDRHPSEGGI